MATYVSPDSAHTKRMEYECGPKSNAPDATPRAANAASMRQRPSQLDEHATRLAAVYRVVPAVHAAGAFSREANLSGGRWSSPGVAAIYAAQSAAGAVLEYLAHMEDEQAQDLVLVHGQLAVQDIAVPDRLPERWRDTPYRDDVRAFGDEWIRSAQAVALQLPSVLCEASCNLLINPDHPRMGRLELVQVQPFTLDPRLVFPK